MALYGASGTYLFDDERLARAVSAPTETLQWSRGDRSRAPISGSAPEG